MSAAPANSSVPSDLTRSFLTLFVPGTVALAPWLLLLVQHTSATLGFKDYPTLAHALIFAAISVVGSVCNGLGTFVEASFDDMLEQELAVKENWYSYLSFSAEKEPVGYRYLSRLAGVLSFELAMLIATPSFVVGGALLTAFRFSGLSVGLVGLISMGVCIALMLFFHWQARVTHRTLCKTHREILTRSRAKSEG